jgi:uncharacterized protein (TIGR03435 family)
MRPIAICLTAGLLFAQGFEVASIKPSGGTSGRGGVDITPGGGLRLTGVNLRFLVAFAYNVNESMITGGPKWMDSAGFDIVAKPEKTTTPTDEHAIVAPGLPTWERARIRTQALLAERFKLVIHKASKPGSSYALVVTKDGPKLEATKPGEEGSPSTMRSHGRIDARRASMSMLAALLTNWLGVQVTDRTGLTGTFNYRLEYAEDAGIAPEMPGSVSTVSGPLQDQLGLKLEAVKGGLETIVVDRAEKPTAN